MTRESAGNDTLSRRTLLAGIGGTASTVIAGCQTPQPRPDTTTTTRPSVVEFVFEGWTSGWIGVSPPAVEGKKNPTLELTAGRTYRVTWENADGVPHNIVIRDADGTDLHRTEIIQQKGQTQTLEFTATEEMATYLCEVHPSTMVGDIAIEGKVTTTTSPAEEFPVHDRLVADADLPAEPQHNVDLRDLMVVIERENESIAIVDTVNHERIARVDDVGTAIHVADFHPKLPAGGRDGAYVYTQSREGWMYKVDLYGFNRVSRIRDGTSARDISTDRTGTYLAGGYYDPHVLSIADADTMEPIKTIEATGAGPSGEQVSSQVHAVADIPTEGLYLIALFDAGRVQLLDYTTPDLPIVADIKVASKLHDGFLGPEGRYFYIASQGDDVMGVVDTKARELETLIDVSAVPHPGPGAVDPARSQAFTTHLGSATVAVWDTDTFELKKVIETPGKGLFIQYHPQSEYVWADVLFDSPETDSLVYQIDPDSLEVARTIDTARWGTGRSLHPEFTRDGSKVYFSLWDAGKLVVLDSETGEHVATIDGFTTPTGKFLGNDAEEHAWSEERGAY